MCAGDAERSAIAQKARRARLSQGASAGQQRSRWERWWLRLTGVSFLLAAAMLYEPWLERYGTGARPLSEGYYLCMAQAAAARYTLLFCAIPGLIAGLIAYQVKACDETGFRSASTDLYVFSRRWLLEWGHGPFFIAFPRFLRSLLFPRRDDPFITRFGKLCWLLVMAASVVPGLHMAMGTLLGAYPLPEAPLHTVSRSAERAFIEHIWRMYTVAAVLAFLLALAWTRLRWPRGARPAAAEAEAAAEEL